MIFPRGMNNEEKAGLKLLKYSGRAFEIKYNYSRYSGGYIANVPSICETVTLSQLTVCKLNPKTI